MTKMIVAPLTALFFMTTTVSYADPEATPAAPAAPAAATPAQAPAKAAEPVKKAKAKDEVVCVQEAKLGTRFTKRVCRSRADMEEQARAEQEAVRQGTTLKPTSGS